MMPPMTHGEVKADQTGDQQKFTGLVPRVRAGFVNSA